MRLHRWSAQHVIAACVLGLLISCSESDPEDSSLDSMQVADVVPDAVQSKGAEDDVLPVPDTPVFDVGTETYQQDSEQLSDTSALDVKPLADILVDDSSATEDVVSDDVSNPDVSSSDEETSSLPLDAGVSDAATLPDAGPVPPAKCVDKQYADKVAHLLATTCSLCHTKEGMASASGLLFASFDAAIPLDRELSNRKTLVEYIQGAAVPDWVVHKPTSVIGHGGGQIFSANSLEAEALSEFVNTLVGDTGCTAVDLPELDPKTFELASPKHTLWLASRLLTDRAPTPAEYDLVTDDIESIEPVLDAFYGTDAFAERIAQMYEDALHTNKFNGKNDSFYIQRAWGAAVDSQGKTRGDYRWMDAYHKPQTDEWKELLIHSTYGFARTARELVSYVVKNQTDFGQILTADYTMMNAYSVRTFGAESLLPLDAPFQPAVDAQQDRTLFAPVVLDTVPTAGLLTDTNFLAGYPTTPVNLNRNRSREVLDHFMATDVLALSNRAILDFGSSEVNPTYNNKDCVVCHKVMDPVSGAYQNWPRVGGYQGVYDPLNQHAQKRWESLDPADQLLPPGATTTSLVPAEQKDTSIQWLAKQIVADPRFGLSVTHTVYEGLTGRKPMRAPELGAKQYGLHLRAYQLERSLLAKVSKSFMASGRNIRVLVTELMKSPLIRTVSSGSPDDQLYNPIAASRVGLSKMPQAETLENKLRAATGYSWYNYYAKTDKGESNYHWNNHIDRPGRSLLVEFREQCGNGGHGCYARWYALMGGLDINPAGGNDTRPTEPNVIIAAILGRMAVEMPWRLVAREFAIKSKADGVFVRRLFPLVSLSTVPETDEGQVIDANVSSIVANIQHLFWQLHGHKRAADDEEVQAAYKLFYDIWKLGLKKGKQLGFAERVDQPELDALAEYEKAMGKPLLQREPVNVDHYNTVRAWRIVLDYMLSDPAFLYDQINGEVAP